MDQTLTQRFSYATIRLYKNYSNIVLDKEKYINDFYNHQIDNVVLPGHQINKKNTK